MRRATSILGLVLTVVIVSGFLALGFVMKVSGYPDVGQRIIRWTPLAFFLRTHGLWLMLLPLLWVICMTSAMRSDDPPSETLVWFSGGSLAFMLMGVFLWACIFPYTRPILFGL